MKHPLIWTEQVVESSFEKFCNLFEKANFSGLLRRVLFDTADHSKLEGTWIEKLQSLNTI